MKQGGDNRLLEYIAADSELKLTAEEIEELLRVERFIGRAVEQTEEYLADVRKLLDVNREWLNIDVQITV